MRVFLIFIIILFLISCSRQVSTGTHLNRIEIQEFVNLTIDVKYSDSEFDQVSNKYNYFYKNEIYYPYFEYVIGTNAIANALEGKTFNFTFSLNFNRDISKETKDNIAINDFYEYKPEMYCEFTNATDTRTIRAKLVNKELIDAHTMDYTFSIILKDYDHKDVYRSFNLVARNIIKCYDPISPIQSALNYTGIAVWSNATTTNIYHSKWNNTLGFVSYVNTSVSIGTTGRFVEGDYSRVRDIGIVCISDTNSDAELVIYNTTTGENITNIQLESNVGQSNQQACNVMFFNMSDNAIIVFENSGSADDQFGLVYFNGSLTSSNFGVENEQNIVFNTPEAGSGSTLNYRLSQLGSGYNETAISWFNIGGVNDSSGFIIYDSNKREQVYNFTTNVTVSPVQSGVTTGTFNDVVWSKNESRYLFFITYNQSGSVTSGDGIFYVHDRYFNSTSTHYLISDNLNELEDIDACALKGNNNSIVFIAQDDNSDVGSYKLFFNGSTEDNPPTVDATTERSSGGNSVNVDCYEEEAKDRVIFGYVNVDGLAVNIFAYNSTANRWENDTSAITNIGTQSYVSENICTDDCEDMIFYPCPEGDCFMVCTVDLASDIGCGSFWNGTSIDISGINVLDSEALTTGRKVVSFLFAGNLTIPEPPAPPSPGGEPDKSSVISILKLLEVIE